MPSMVADPWLPLLSAELRSVLPSTAATAAGATAAATSAMPAVNSVEGSAARHGGPSGGSPFYKPSMVDDPWAPLIARAATGQHNG